MILRSSLLPNSSASLSAPARSMISNALQLSLGESSPGHLQVAAMSSVVFSRTLLIPAEISATADDEIHGMLI